MNYPGYTQFLKAHGIPEPICELQAIPGRKYRFDYAWPHCKIALEIEGGIYTHGAHGSISGKKRDIEKYRLAAANGWRILQATPSTNKKKKDPLEMDSEATIACLKQALRI